MAIGIVRRHAATDERRGNDEFITPGLRAPTNAVEQTSVPWPEQRRQVSHEFLVLIPIALVADVQDKIPILFLQQPIGCALDCLDDSVVRSEAPRLLWIEELQEHNHTQPISRLEDAFESSKPSWFHTTVDVETGHDLLVRCGTALRVRLVLGVIPANRAALEADCHREQTMSTIVWERFNELIRVALGVPCSYDTGATHGGQHIR